MDEYVKSIVRTALCAIDLIKAQNKGGMWEIFDAQTKLDTATVDMQRCSTHMTAQPAQPAPPAPPVQPIVIATKSQDADKKQPETGNNKERSKRKIAEISKVDIVKRSKPILTESQTAYMRNQQLLVSLQTLGVSKDDYDVLHELAKTRYPNDMGCNGFQHSEKCKGGESPRCCSVSYSVYLYKTLNMDTRICNM
jgi:hypothetical protein